MAKKKFDLQAFKDSIKIVDVPLKPDKYVVLDECIQDVLKLKGMPLGHVVQCAGPSDSGKCLSLDSSRVITDKGVFTLREAIENDTQYVENKKIGYWLNDGHHKGKKITFNDGSVLEGTNNHKIKVLTENLALEWKRLDELTLLDYVPSTESKYTFNNPFSEDLAELYGWIIADGHMSGKNITFSGLLEPKKSLLRNLMQKLNLYSENNSYLYVNVENTEKLNLRYHCLAGTKTVPKEILTSNKKAICAFIRGLFSGDGNLGQGGGSIEWSTASEQLAREVQFLLKSLGLPCTIRAKTAAITNHKIWYYKLIITGGRPNLLKYQQLIGFSHSEKQLKLELGLLKTDKYCSKAFIPYANELVSNSYRSADVECRNRTAYALCGNVLRRRDQLTRERWVIIRDEPFINSYARDKIDSIKDYNFLTIESIEEWKGEVGDPHIPEDNTYVVNNLISHNTSLLFHIAAQAQLQNIMPVLIVTEGKVDWSRAEAMGFDKSQAIVVENLKYLEEIFDFMDNKIINNVMNGSLDSDVIILWDSMGNTMSEKSFELDKKTGERKVKNTHMQTAAIKSERLSILMDRVNETRKITYPNTVGAFIINSVYKGTAAYPGSPIPDIIKGGEKVRYTASLIIKTKCIKKLEAVKAGAKLKFGMVSRLSVIKNHINGQEFSGEFIVTADKFLPNDAKELKKYKEEHSDKWGSAELYEAEDEIADEDF